MARLPIDAARRRQIEEIFEEALALAPAGREQHLIARCGSDHNLRVEVDALIAAHERADGILEGSVGAAAEEALRSVDRGHRIGAYRVIRELGRGGMGVVYLAERDDGQYEQRVALKLLRVSPDTEELRPRFVAERQILASLKHRNIAQLLDGGLADGQLPFLVMEYVDGVPITVYCDRHMLGIDARLRLFRDVCAAVHYAHQNLIIHRDIKPGNILVSDEGGVKLLDFGIAKLLNPVFGPAQPTTRVDRRPMTPEYASPEQLRGHVLTTTSDVYALGVVLYELLTGRRPYHLTSGSLQELTEIVSSQEPERPSVAVTRPVPSAMRSGRTPEELAQARGVSPERLRHLLSGDLDAIVLMALRKEVSDRYGSADLLWEDLQRHLDGLPVHAHRGTRRYRARKFLGRHRIESVAAAVVALSLTVGAAIAVRQATVAERERDRAERALADAEQLLRQSESVTGFLVGLFDVAAPMPSGGIVTAHELLRRGTAQLDNLDDQPLTQARMLEAMGRVHATMAQYQEGRAALERSLALRVERLGPNHPEVAGTLYYLADVMRRISRYNSADSLSRRALAIRTAAFGTRHPATAEVLAQMAMIAVYLSDLTGAEEMSRRALEIRRETLEPNERLIGASLELHAAHLRRLGRNAEAEAQLREAIAVYRAGGGPKSPDAASLQLRLADVILGARGDTAQAESLMRSSLTLTRSVLGDEHQRTVWAMGDLADLLSIRGRYAEAEQLARAGLEIERRIFGPRHSNVAGNSELLAVVLKRAGKFAEAERAQRLTLDILDHTLGPNHTAYAHSLGMLADILIELGRYDEAIATRRRLLEIRGRLFGDTGATYGIDLSRLARVHARKGDYRVADSLFDIALANQRRFVPETHHDIRDLYGLMSERYRLEGKRTEAARYANLAQRR